MKEIIKKIITTSNNTLLDDLRASDSIYTFLNPVSYLEARKNKELFRDFDGIFVDGAILVLFIYLLYKKKVKRYSFDMTSVAPMVFEFAIKEKKTVFLIGSQKHEISKAKENLQRNYSELNIVGIKDGYFKNDEEIELTIREILNLKPDFVIVGMGIIRQEQFLIKLKKNDFSGVGFTCGGFIHQTTEDCVDYYPHWINKLNIRFLYRMYKEKHTRKRYVKSAFLFPFYFLFDYCCKE